MSGNLTRDMHNNQMKRFSRYFTLKWVKLKKKMVLLNADRSAKNILTISYRNPK